VEYALLSKRKTSHVDKAAAYTRVTIDDGNQGISNLTPRRSTREAQDEIIAPSFIPAG